MGDEVLKFIAEVVTRSVREHDTVVRWGGEEFLVLLPETNIDGAMKVAEKIRIAIQEFKIKKIPKQITASFGVTTLFEGDIEEEFIKKADIALYKAKKEGRNRVVSYTT